MKEANTRIAIKRRSGTVFRLLLSAPLLITPQAFHSRLNFHFFKNVYLNPSNSLPLKLSRFKETRLGSSSSHLSLYLSISISVYLSLSLSHYLYLYLSISLSLSISLYLCLSISISRSLSLCLYLFLSISISVSLSLPLSLSLSSFPVLLLPSFVI